MSGLLKRVERLEQVMGQEVDEGDWIRELSDEELDARIMRLLETLPPLDLEVDADGFYAIPEGMEDFDTIGRDVRTLSEEELNIALAVRCNKIGRLLETAESRKAAAEGQGNEFIQTD